MRVLRESNSTAKTHPVVNLLLIDLLALIVPAVILAHPDKDFRCSHKPPPPEEVNHVWLNEANFSAHADDDIILNQEDARGKSPKSRRHISNSNEVRGSEPTAQDSIWGLFKKLQRPSMLTDDEADLVPLRIQVHYDDSVYLLDRQRRDLINETVMPTVVDFFESVLSIKREHTVTQKFRMSRRCPNNTIYYARDFKGRSRPYCMERCEDYAICGEMVVPQAHLSACSYCNSTSKVCSTNYATEGKGVSNSHLLLYVSAKHTARCRKDSTIAYAAHCAQDIKMDRPVAGHANLCPSSISADVRDLKALIGTVKHELTHVLGFSVSLFAYYRDEFGRPLTERDSLPGPIPVDPVTGYSKWSDKVIRRVVRRNWTSAAGSTDREAHLVVTPTVVREVRRHFNCSDLEGAELEDQGSDGTSMTHWEKRLFENEAMTGTHTQNSVYSRLTLAVLQDTGWYVANFSQADKLDWGKDLGCDFAKKSCKAWIDEKRKTKQSIKPFCDSVKRDLLHISCTEDRLSKAVCNLKQYKEPLAAVYRNFDHIDEVADEHLPYFGGSVDLADYCPFIQEFTWQAQNVTVRASRCDPGDTTHESDNNFALEHYGPQTRCFEHGRMWEQRSCAYKRNWHHYGAGCYRYICSGGHVKVLLGNYTHNCYYQDQMVHVEQIVGSWFHNGTLLCPACDQVCAAHKCRSYDRNLIDRISSFIRGNRRNKMSDRPEDLVEAFLDEAQNSVDIQGDLEVFLESKLKTRHSSNSTELNKSIDLKGIRDYLLQVFTHHRQPPRHSLVCSGSESLSRLNSMSNLTVLVWISVLLFAVNRIK